MKPYDRVKRVLDLLASVTLLVVLIPVLLVVMAVVYMSLGTPILFKQQRVGLGEKLFELFKFRTMRHGKAGLAGVSTDRERISNAGQFLRRWSLDELPQLINVIRGDMSLVGPRPLFPEYLAHYNDYQKRRHEVLPGITGLAQVSGRNALSWEDKFRLDVQYVDERSLLLDLKILLATARKLIKPQGIQGREGTVEPFGGAADSESGSVK